LAADGYARSRSGASVSRDDRRYARFYYPEFIRDYPEVYADDAAFAAWMRLLVIAEQMWPMPAELPRSVRPRPLRTLVDAGLVSLTGVTFALKGHAAERQRRSDTGRNAAALRWDSERSANAVPSTSTSRDETSIPPPPTSGGRRKDATNPRSTGAAPRQNGHAPRDLGESPRQRVKAEKRDMTPLHVILARSNANRSEP
jgi:hypothetical protein